MLQRSKVKGTASRVYLFEPKWLLGPPVDSGNDEDDEEDDEDDDEDADVKDFK